VLLTFILLFVFVANIHAYQFSSQSFYNFQSFNDFFQNRSWDEWGQVYDNEITLGWIQEQIEAVMSQLEGMGFAIPVDVEFYLIEVIRNAFDRLRENRIFIPNFNSKFLDKPDYNFSWNYNVMNQNMDFSTDNFFSGENMNVLVDFGGNFSADVNSPWNLNFSIQSTSFDRTKIAFNQVRTTSRQNIIRQRREKHFQTRLPSSIGQRAWEFILQGEICQDGLISLRINPHQATTLNLWNSTFTSKTGIEILQDAVSQEGKFYLDITQDNGVGGASQVYYWESPL
jgi:hypothetical protein